MHVDGDQEDLEEREVQEGRANFLHEMERLKETPSINPAVVDPTADAMQVESRSADGRKRRKPERFFACPASGKRSATGWNTDLNVVNFTDSVHEVERLKQKYSLFSGRRPTGPCASKASWLREKVATFELEMSTTQMRSGEDTKKASAVHQNDPKQPKSHGASPATDNQQGMELTLHNIEHSLASKDQLEQPPALASQIVGPRKIQTGDKILCKLHLDDCDRQSDEREQWFIGTVKKTGKEDVCRHQYTRAMLWSMHAMHWQTHSFPGVCRFTGSQLVDVEANRRNWY